MSLYEQLGGEPAIDATVEKFYELVLNDALLAPLFKKTDMKKQKRMQKSFLNHVLGNKPFSGKSMKQAHKGLKLKDTHFDHVAKHLGDAMLSLGVAQKLVDETLAIAETTRNDVLGREPKPEGRDKLFILGAVAFVASVGVFYYMKGSAAKVITEVVTDSK